MYDKSDSFSSNLVSDGTLRKGKDRKKENQSLSIHMSLENEIFLSHDSHKIYALLKLCAYRFERTFSMIKRGRYMREKLKAFLLYYP